MISIIVITCIICQTAVAIYLLNIKKLENDFDKSIIALLIILLSHLVTKFFLLVVLKNSFLYNKVASGFGFAYGPFLYIITRSFMQKPLSHKQRFLHLLPFLLFTAVYFILIAGESLKLISDYFIIHYTANYQYLVAVSLIVYPFIVQRLLRNPGHADVLAPEKRKLIGNIAMVLLAGILLGLFFAFTNILRVPIRNFDLRVLPYICFAFIPVLILRYKMQETAAMQREAVQPVAAVEEKEPEHSEKRYQKSALDEAMMDEYALVLENFIRKSRIYLNAELSLEELAAQVKIPKHHLTQLLNDRFKKNFYSFVNAYRIDEAVKKLKDPNTELSILSLAYDCGFNSKSSFNNYFKKITTHTPSEYRKIMLEEAAEKHLAS